MVSVDSWGNIPCETVVEQTPIRYCAKMVELDVDSFLRIARDALKDLGCPFYQLIDHLRQGLWTVTSHIPRIDLPMHPGVYPEQGFIETLGALAAVLCVEPSILLDLAIHIDNVSKVVGSSTALEWLVNGYRRPFLKKRHRVCVGVVLGYCSKECIHTPSELILYLMGRDIARAVSAW